MTDGIRFLFGVWFSFYSLKRERSGGFRRGPRSGDRKVAGRLSSECWQQSEQHRPQLRQGWLGETAEEKSLRWNHCPCGDQLLGRRHRVSEIRAIREETPEAKRALSSSPKLKSLIGV